VSTNFHIFATKALAVNTNLTAGAHTWSATIKDYADNLTTTSATFHATGTND
jgi:hypothetical protein